MEIFEDRTPINSLLLLVRGTVRCNNIKDGAFLDLVLFDNLSIDVHKVPDFEIEEILDASDISLTAFHGFADLLQHAAHAAFHVFKLIFGDLAVKVGEVGDWADSVEDSLITNDRGAGPEGSNHGYAFLRSECTESLMLDVATLQDNGAALRKIVRKGVNLRRQSDILPWTVRGPS